MHLRYDKLKEVNGCACRWIYERVNLRAETCAWSHFTCMKSMHADFKFVEPWFICSFSICLLIPRSLLLVYIETQQTFVGLQDVLKTSLRHVLKTSSTRLQRNHFFVFQDVLKTFCKTS